jgi:hypothetical protein
MAARDPPSTEKKELPLQPLRLAIQALVRGGRTSSAAADYFFVSFTSWCRLLPVFSRTVFSLVSDL